MDEFAKKHKKIVFYNLIISLNNFKISYQVPIPTK